MYFVAAAESFAFVGKSDDGVICFGLIRLFGFYVSFSGFVMQSGELQFGLSFVAF
ncbi:MAG: hypothetical protein IJ748_01315 [Bacteroidales bacterium]|nr:hypothetical protein [Bacteroidales bacterium]